MSELIECEPNLGNFTKSLLSIGYTHYTALLDIIDNSIANESSKVWVNYYLEDNTTKIIISDNGSGMSDQQLFEAMRIASADPIQIRKSESDLGKFGLGLKLASFSQTDTFQVISKTEHEDYVSYCWDLNTVRKENKWLIKKEKVYKFRSEIERKSGTDVILIDLRDFDNIDIQKVISRLYYHLATVYNLFPGVEFFINGNKVTQIDPFFTSPGSNSTEYEPISHSGIIIRVRSFQVPHRDNLNPKNKKDFDSLKDIGMSDGIYLYRKNRLIAWSGWEGLSSNKRIADLHRLAIYIEEDADKLFNIEVKKSQISILDDSLRKKIITKIKTFTNTARRPYQKRAELSLKDIADLWGLVNNDDKISFRLNKESKIVKRFAKGEITLSEFLDLIDGTMPIDSILYYLNTDRMDRDEYKEMKLNSAEILYNLGLLSEEDFNKFK
jgi:hypothetical protein